MAAIDRPMRLGAFFCRIALAGACALAARLTVAQEANVIRLTSAEWPPYTSETMKQQGALSAVVRAAFSAVGYRVEIEYYPWARAVKLVKDPKKPFHAYFPEYYDSANAQEVIYSVPIASSPLGFAEHTARQVKWATLDDLDKFRVGVVNGYINTPALDERIAKGAIQTDIAPTDANNLLKLEAGRIDLAVVDPVVFHYLSARNPQLSAKHQNLRMNPVLLEDKKLYVGFKKGEEGQRLEREFAKGLKKINADAIVSAYLKDLAEHSQ